MTHPDAPPLPAHRVPVRMALLAPAGGLGAALLTGAAALAVAPGGAEGALRAGVPMALVATLWCGLLVLTEELSRHVRRGARPLALLLAGSLATLFVVACLTWAQAVVHGRGVEGGASLLADVARDARRQLRTTALLALVGLLPFFALGCARVVARAELEERLAMAAMGGVGTFVVVLLLEHSVRRMPGKGVTAVGLQIVGATVGAAAGLALGERLEGWALARWARWREERAP